MKTIILTALLFCTTLAYCQDTVYDQVDVNAAPIEGIETLYEHIASHLKYPENAKKEGLEGTVYVGLIIGKNGAVEELEVIKGFNSTCDQAALQALNDSGKWIPAKYQGKIVRQKIVIPVKFALKDAQETN